MSRVSGAGKYDWVLEFDIKGLFDNLPPTISAESGQTTQVHCKWALLYIERWLTAPMEKGRTAH